MAMGKQQAPEADAAEAKKLQKAAKRAAQEGAIAVVEESVEVDAAEAKRQRKAAKLLAAENAVAEEAPEADEAEAKRQRKAAKKAAKAAAAGEAPEQAPEVAEEAPADIDEEEAKRQRKAAKKAAKAAAAVAEEAPEVIAEQAPEESDEAAAKKQRKAAKKAAKAASVEEPEENAVDTPKRPKKRVADSDQEEVVETPAKKQKQEAECTAGGKAKGKGNKELEIFIGGLPFSTTEDVLKKDFAECGEYVSFRMPLNDEGNARGIAFIEYKSKESCDKALKFNGTEYGGRILSVRMSGEQGMSKGKGKDGKDGKGKGKGNEEFQVFIGGLPFSTTEDVLKKDFAECGEIVSFRMPLNDEGNARGIAFVEYKDKESCDKALKFNETEYGGRYLTVRMAGDKGKGKGKEGKEGKGKGKGNKEFEVFIGGLPFSTTEDVLKKDFAECGEIVSFRMPLNDEGNARGIAFVEYKDKESCDKALKFNETDYGGRTLSVRMSGDSSGKDGKGKDKGKGKGKKGKNKSGLSNEKMAANSGAMVASTGEKKTFDDSDDE